MPFHCEWVGVWLFNANSAIFQLYHRWSKLIFNQWNDEEVCFVLDQHASLQYWNYKHMQEWIDALHVYSEI
jgi:hypothetical protein